MTVASDDDLQPVTPIRDRVARAVVLAKALMAAEPS
jgi:hypothetical protein